MEIKDIKPKLLEVEDLIEIFQACNMTGRIYSGSPLYRVFAHIAALTALLLKERSERKKA
jgi:hypothetical protein